MRKVALAVCSASILGLCGCGGPTVGKVDPSSIPANAITVHVTATDFKWTLDRSTFKVGVPIDFVVKANEGEHGFSIAGVNLPAVNVAVGDTPKNLLWTPTSAGTYEIACNYYCGSGHDTMYTSFNVTS